MEQTIESILQKYPGKKKENLILLLQDIAQQNGYLSPENLREVSSYLKIPLNKVYGVVSFYDKLNLLPRGIHHFQVCNGTSCHMSGSVTILRELEKLLQVKPGQTSRDKKFSLETIPCSGSCSQSPLVFVNGDPCPGISRENLSKMIRSMKENKD
jgi:NADH:ubiquinone oxidoreductase subunit E